MRRAAAILTIALAGTGGGCSHSGASIYGSGASNPTAISTTAIPARDRDGDRDNLPKAYYDRDDYFGPHADARDQKAVIALAKRYYTLAVAGNARSICPLVYWAIVEEMSEEQERVSGKAAPGEGACIRTMADLFRRRHAQFVSKAATMKTIGVMENSVRAWVMMKFGNGEERHLVMHRDGGAWKLWTWEDRPLP